MTCQSLINYFIIDRKSGISYDTYFCGSSYIIAYPNIATGKQTLINYSRLLNGLKEKRYRLVKKSN